MLNRRSFFVALAGLAALFGLSAAPALAQTASPELVRRAQDVLAMLRGEADLPAMFTPDFLAQVPAAQIAAISQQLGAASGPPRSVHAIEPTGPNRATLVIAMERDLVRMTMGLEAAPPHRIATLLITGTEPRGGDSAQALVAELRELPGEVSFAVARLDGAQPALIAQHQPDRTLAIGSTFKLVILGELASQVREGRRRWTDVVTIDRHSLPSGLLQDWPLGAPLTLHSLAALMISRSDNTATDILLRVVGRENVERMMTAMGMGSAARNRPFLTTMEAFQLKADSADAIAAWGRADEAARRRLLRERYEEGGAAIDLSRFTATPMAIDTVEWFASANDLVRVMDWLRRNGDETAHGILAIGPGVSREIAGEFGYVGFKGGSEPGVINLTYLIRNNEGVWHVATGSWNNPAAAVEEARFVGLMTRAVRLVR